MAEPPFHLHRTGVVPVGEHPERASPRVVNWPDYPADLDDLPHSLIRLVKFRKLYLLIGMMIENLGAAIVYQLIYGKWIQREHNEINDSYQ